MNQIKNEKEAIECIKNYNILRKKLEKLAHSEFDYISIKTVNYYTKKKETMIYGHYFIDDYAGKKEKSDEYPIKWLFMTEEEIKKDAEKRDIVSWDSGETRKYYDFLRRINNGNCNY